MTRIEEVDDVEHEKSEEQRKQEKEESLEKGGQGENTILDNQANWKELNTR